MDGEQTFFDIYIYIYIYIYIFVQLLSSISTSTLIYSGSNPTGYEKLIGIIESYGASCTHMNLRKMTVSNNFDRR